MNYTLAIFLLFFAAAYSLGISIKHRSMVALIFGICLVVVFGAFAVDLPSYVKGGEKLVVSTLDSKAIFAPRKRFYKWRRNPIMAQIPTDVGVLWTGGSLYTSNAALEYVDIYQALLASGEYEFNDLESLIAKETKHSTFTISYLPFTKFAIRVEQDYFGKTILYYSEKSDFLVGLSVIIIIVAGNFLLKFIKRRSD